MHAHGLNEIIVDLHAPARAGDAAKRFFNPLSQFPCHRRAPWAVTGPWRTTPVRVLQPLRLVARLNAPRSHGLDEKLVITFGLVGVIYGEFRYCLIEGVT